jgi:hypothetical protein
MDFPRFDGSNPQEWLQTTKIYFDMVYVPEDAKFDYAQMYITGKADTWLCNSGVLEEHLTWQQFCDVLLLRFSENTSYDILEDFNSIKQGNYTISEYTNRFEEKMVNYRKENPDVKESYYIKCYINGLKGEIKHHIKSLQPTSLYQAVEYARNTKQGVNAAAHNSRKQFPANAYQKSNYSNNQYRPKPALEASAPRQEADKGTVKSEAKIKEPNLCRYCGQRWFFGHRCQQYKNLNLMTTAGDDPDELDSPDEEDTPAPEQQPLSTAAEEHLMQISVQTAQGGTSSNTFTLLVTIGGKQGITLVDTGSTHTFIDLKFSTKINCKIVTHALEKVQVAGGGELLTGAHVTPMDYLVQGHTFNNSFKVLQLKGYDIVLGGTRC